MTTEIQNLSKLEPLKMWETINKFSHPVIVTFENLMSRWEDEKEYESFSEYKKAMKSCLVGFGLKMIAMTTKSFTIQLWNDNGTLIQKGLKVTLKANRSSVQLIASVINL